jgi:hypothetical protein
MNRLVIASAVLLAFSAAPASAQMITGPEGCAGGPAEPASFALAKGVVETIIPPELADSMMQQLMGSIMAQMQQGLGNEVTDPGLRALLDRKMDSMPARLGPLLSKHLPSMRAAMACAYVREFSVQELREIGSFAESPAGKHYLSRSVAMVSDPTVIMANQAYFSDAKVYLDSLREELKTEIGEYLAKNTKQK